MSKCMQCNIVAMVAAVLLSPMAFGATNRAAVPESASSSAPAASAGPASSPHAASQRLSPKDKLALDRSGKHRVGKASFYAHMFSGRKMANGKLMDPKHNNAASLTLPLGTTAKVTNLATGKSAVVIIQDRGPYVSGRIVDLSPATAAAIGITPRQGVAKVQVSPITIPQPNGETIYGAAIQDARLASNDQAHRQFPPVGW